MLSFWNVKSAVNFKHEPPIWQAKSENVLNPLKYNVMMCEKVKRVHFLLSISAMQNGHT